jgi:superfamily II DNA helicase RecQ
MNIKVKAFQIRLNETHLSIDQETVNNFLSGVTVKKTASSFVADSAYWSVLAYYTEDRPQTQQSSAQSVSKLFFPVDTELSEDEKRVYETLKDWRQGKADAQGVPSYLVAGNAELITISKVRPQNLDDLIKIRGFGSHKVAKYGDDIIALLNSVN